MGPAVWEKEEEESEAEGRNGRKKPVIADLKEGRGHESRHAGGLEGLKTQGHPCAPEPLQGTQPC